MSAPYWMIPALLTPMIWVTAIYWPKGESGGGYNFGPAILAVVHMIAALIATLVVWLIFFMVF